MISTSTKSTIIEMYQITVTAACGTS